MTGAHIPLLFKEGNMRHPKKTLRLIETARSRRLENSPSWQGGEFFYLELMEFKYIQLRTDKRLLSIGPPHNSLQIFSAHC